METNILNIKHIGRKIERIRKLRGFTQDQIAQELGISKQAVSKIEQSETLDDQRLKQIADLLGVTVDGLKTFNEENVFHYTTNFFEQASFTNSSVNTQTLNVNNPIEKIIELYENLLKVEREKIEILKKQAK